MIREPAAKKRESDRGRGMRFSLASCRRVLCPREWPPGDTGQRSEREVGRGALTVPRRKRCVSSEKEKPPRARIARSGDGSPSSDPTLGIDVDPPLIRAGTAHRKKVFLFFLERALAISPLRAIAHRSFAASEESHGKQAPSDREAGQPG